MARIGFVPEVSASRSVYTNDGSKKYTRADGSYFTDMSTFKQITNELESQNITDLLGYTTVKNEKTIEYDKNLEQVVPASTLYTIRQSDLPAVPPQNYKELVQKTADAYRKKSSTTAQVSVGELPDKIRSLKVEGGVPPNGREWKQSNLTTRDFNHICCGENGIWVAGGEQERIGIGILYYSLDGIDWNEISIGMMECSALCCANGMFVASGLNGGYMPNIWYSYDGIHWIEIKSRYRAQSTSIKYGNGLWVAVIDGLLYSSTDGKNWNRINAPNAVIDTCYADTGIWICATASDGIHWSEDNCNTWHKSDFPGKPQGEIFYADGLFLTNDADIRGVGKGIWYSINGKEWVQSNINDGLFSFTYFDGFYYAANTEQTIGGGDETPTIGICRSNDGKTWENISNVNAYNIYSDHGIILYEDTNSKLFYSVDGISYKSSALTAVNQISYANGIWVAATNNGLYYSLASFDRSPAPMPVEDTSWATASEAKITSMLADAKAGKINLEDYWKVGDTRKITLDNKSYSGNAGSMTTSNEEVELVLAEPLSVSTSYGAKNGFIVTTKNCLKTRMMMNSNGTNTGSFAGSNMCAFLNDSANGFLGMLPDWLANNLLIANVKTADPYNGTTIKTTQHKIFLPTERNIFGDGYGYEGLGYSNNTEAKLAELKHWKYYQTTSNRVKQVNGSDSYWWVRSPCYDHSNYFCDVDSSGDAYNDGASGSRGVAPCFCIGTPPAKSITASVSTVSGASYGFAKNSNGYFESQNKGYHSTAALCKLTITVTGSYNVSLDCINYAESNYDFGLISTKNGTLSTSYTEDSNVLKSFKGLSQSGVQNVSLGTLKDETATFYIKFRKDSSSNNYNDSLQWKLKADGNVIDVAGGGLK